MDQALDLYDNQFNKVLANSIFRVIPIVNNHSRISNSLPRISLSPSSMLISTPPPSFFTMRLASVILFRASSPRPSMFKPHRIHGPTTKCYLKPSLRTRTYFTSIFSTNSDLPLPASWIWDILDEYVYQFYTCSRWRKNIRKDDLDGLETYFKKDGFDFWNLEKVMTI